MKKLILSTLLCCALSTHGQMPSDTTKPTIVLATEKPKKKKKFRTWDRISIGVFAIVTAYFFIKTNR